MWGSGRYHSYISYFGVRNVFLNLIVICHKSLSIFCRYFGNLLNNDYINCCILQISSEKWKCYNCGENCKFATVEKQMFCIWEIHNFQIYLWYLPMKLWIAIFIRRSAKLLIWKYKKCFICYFRNIITNY